MKKFTVKVRATLLLVIYILSVFAVQNTSLTAFAADENSCTGVGISENEGEITQAAGVKISSRLFELLFGKNEKKEEIRLYPGGGIFGLDIDEDGATVVTSDSHAIKVGDRIVGINGNVISDPKDVESTVEKSGGKPLSIELIRAGEKINVTVTPKSDDGKFKLGVRLRGEVAGIGTVTYVMEDGSSFGGLGHGVNDQSTSSLVSISHADVRKVTLGSCHKGEAGRAGELVGVLKSEKCGSIYSNTECGVFGTLDTTPDYCSELLPIGRRAEVKEGDAEIISTVKNGLRATYSIKIEEIDRTSTGSKSFRIRVTDPTLITLTGGIVRGMSGSPIIQDGKLVGAVTHVLVANPTEGYGIFIENMLSAAESDPTQKAA